MNEKPKFNTITGADWRKSLSESRKRRSDAPKRIRESVEKTQPNRERKVIP